MSSCPTSAIYEPYRINPQRCITCLLTSEDLPQIFWGKLQHYILGCDICQENCPKNKGLRPKNNVKGLLPDWIGNNPLLEDLLNLDERSFQKKIISHITGKITGSPLLGFISRYSWQKIFLKHLLRSFGGKETMPETFVYASSKLHAYQRNAIIAAGSIGDPKLRSNIKRFLDNPSLQKYADWALKRIGT